MASRSPTPPATGTTSVSSAIWRVTYSRACVRATRRTPAFGFILLSSGQLHRNRRPCQLSPHTAQGHGPASQRPEPPTGAAQDPPEIVGRQQQPAHRAGVAQHPLGGWEEVSRSRRRRTRPGKDAEIGQQQVGFAHAGFEEGGRQRGARRRERPPATGRASLAAGSRSDRRRDAIHGRTPRPPRTGGTNRPTRRHPSSVSRSARRWIS